MHNPYGGGPPPGYGPPHPQGQLQQYPQQQPQPQHAPAYAPPHGYNQQQPQQPVANGQWGPQGQAMQPRLVGGIPLERTEKVLYFYRASRIYTVVFGLIMGVLLIPAFGIGLLLIYGSVTDRSSGIYCQTMTNKRIMAINGHGKVLWEIRWEDVRGLNKVVGRRYEFGVRNAQGKKLMFSDNVHIVEMVLTKLAETPMLREQSPEVQFDSYVN